MASGLASTTRFIGILVSVAGMGAVLSSVVHRAFGTAAVAIGYDTMKRRWPPRQSASRPVISPVCSVSAAPTAMRSALHAAGLASFADGFAAASLLAAIIGLAACLLTFLLIRTEDTAPVPLQKDRPCKFVDCRDQL
jgi:hypothetical protein